MLAMVLFVPFLIVSNMLWMSMGGDTMLCGCHTGYLCYIGFREK